MRSFVPMLLMLLSALGISCPPVAGQSRNVEAMPFVGCPTEGMNGWEEAPRSVRSTPSVGETEAPRLAYYASPNLGVIAPRGWHCLEIWGSSGAILFVAPTLPATGRPQQLDGPAIVLERFNGDTSGRFLVARLAARLFPIADDYVKGVIALGFEPSADFPTGPYPADTIVRRDKTTVEYVTPGNADGLGTNGWLAKGSLPVSGIVMLLPDENMDAVKLDIRLADDFRALAPQIAEDILAGHGRVSPN